MFVRSGDDFIRLTTSHKKENGERAIGIILDNAHPGYAAIMAGETYAGAATLFGGQYMTKYDPIRDASGKVIGILYVGVNFTDSMRSLSNGIKTMKLGDDDEYYAIGTKAAKGLGKLLISKDNESFSTCAPDRQDRRRCAGDLVAVSSSVAARPPSSGKTGPVR